VTRERFASLLQLLGVLIVIAAGFAISIPLGAIAVGVAVFGLGVVVEP